MRWFLGREEGAEEELAGSEPGRSGSLLRYVKIPATCNQGEEGAYAQGSKDLSKEPKWSAWECGWARMEAASLKTQEKEDSEQPEGPGAGTQGAVCKKQISELGRCPALLCGQCLSGSRSVSMS